MSKTTAVVLLASFVGALLGASTHAQNPMSRADSAPAAAPLPKDVYPDSRYRLPLPKREDMDDYGKKVFDELTDPEHGERTGLGTPAGIRLYSPKLAKPMSEAFRYLRTETGLGDRLTEMAILVTAREMDNQYEWASHEPAGLKAGVEPKIIDIVKYRKPLSGLGEKEMISLL